MNDEQRLSLIRNVVEIVANDTNLREEDSFGDDLAELVLVIAGGGSVCELYKNSEVQYDFYLFLGRFFEPEHFIWNFIELVEDDEEEVK